MMGASVVLVDLDPTVFGAIVDIGGAKGISINAQLAGAGFAGTLGHELGHACQPGMVCAFCSTMVAASGREREAHVLASVFTVPFGAIEHVDLHSEEPAVLAQELNAPRPYVHMRNALAVVLGEKRGDVRLARILLNGSLLAHQMWMRELSAELQGNPAPVVSATCYDRRTRRRP
jgi:hypothetical protein